MPRSEDSNLLFSAAFSDRFSPAFLAHGVGLIGGNGITEEEGRMILNKKRTTSSHHDSPERGTKTVAFIP
jgi:hypothetical protein